MLSNFLMIIKNGNIKRKKREEGKEREKRRKNLLAHLHIGRILFLPVVFIFSVFQSMDYFYSISMYSKSLSET